MTSPRPIVVRDNGPCRTCPYRVDVPSGVWSADEYAKLRRYDGDILAQAIADGGRPFACHSTPEDLCAGWAGHRDPTDLLAVRLGIAGGHLDPAVAEYRTDVALHPSGAAAAAHGEREIDQPGPAAVAAIGKVSRLIDSRGVPSADQPPQA